MFELLYTKNKGLICSVCMPLVRPGVELDDLQQESYFALVRAAESFNEQQGSFVNYLGLWCRWWLLRYIQNNGRSIRIPVHQMERIRQYKKLCSSFEADFGRQPTSAELCSALELSPAQIEMVKADAMLLTIGSTDSLVPGLDEEQTIIETIPDQENNIDDLIDDIQRQELAVKLWSIVSKLSERDQYILRARYKEGKTLKQCADELGKALTTVATQQKQAFRKIRKSEDAPVLRSFLDDDLEARSYRWTGLSAFRHSGTSIPEKIALERVAAKENREK